jgi:sugar lactone lactonase YvrE
MTKTIGLTKNPFDIMLDGFAKTLTRTAITKTTSNFSGEETLTEGEITTTTLKMFITGAITDSVHSYTLETLNDITTLTYDGKSRFVGDKEATPHGLTFNNDGTKMYIIGQTQDTVFEYVLSIPYDITTAVFSVSYSIQSKENTPTDIKFSSDGTKMFILGDQGNDITLYTLSTPWNISTSVYVTEKSINTEDGVSQGIWFKEDGTKMYMVGSANDRVYEYNLTAWDITTLTYVNRISVAGQGELTPTAVALNTDGTIMWITGTTNDFIEQYNLSTPWDITTAVYSNRKAIGSSEGNPTGLHFITVTTTTGSVSETIEGSFFKKEDAYTQEQVALMQNADAILLVKTTVTINKDDKITYDSLDYRVQEVETRKLGTIEFYKKVELFLI